MGDQNKFDKASAFFLESLAIYQQIGHPHGQATVLCQLGITALSLGEDSREIAELKLLEALIISTEINASPLTLEILSGFALLWSEIDKVQSTHPKLVQVLTLINNHQASEQETKDRVKRLWDKLTATLPDKVMAKRRSPRSNADIEEIVKRVLENWRSSGTEA